MGSMLRKLWALWRDESGISAVEYALLLAFVGGSIIVAAGELGGAVENEISDAATCLNTDGASC